MIALLLALLASFSAPGAALAHGSAHEREHHGKQACADAARPARHDHSHGAAHHEHAMAGATAEAGRTAADLALGGLALASADESDGSHVHPTLDLPVRPRVELAAVLPLMVVATLLAMPAIDVTTGAPVPHAALARPDPDAAPPPRTRAPPLR